MGAPPSVAGAAHETVTWREPLLASTPVGAPGTVLGVPDRLTEAAPGPTALRARTAIEYSSPLFSPPTVSGLASEPGSIHSPVSSSRYSMAVIGEPPIVARGERDHERAVAGGDAHRGGRRRGATGCGQHGLAGRAAPGGVDGPELDGVDRGVGQRRRAGIGLGGDEERRTDRPADAGAPGGATIGRVLVSGDRAAPVAGGREGDREGLVTGHDGTEGRRRRGGEHLDRLRDRRRGRSRHRSRRGAPGCR